MMLLRYCYDRSSLHSYTLRSRSWGVVSSHRLDVVFDANRWMVHMPAKVDPAITSESALRVCTGPQNHVAGLRREAVGGGGVGQGAQHGSAEGGGGKVCS